MGNYLVDRNGPHTHFPPPQELTEALQDGRRALDLLLDAMNNPGKLLRVWLCLLQQ
jgi:hypothetical protein